jgi:hypothetical protein
MDWASASGDQTNRIAEIGTDAPNDLDADAGTREIGLTCSVIEGPVIPDGTESTVSVSVGRV